MSKNKQQKFAEMATFPNVVQPKIIGRILSDFELKGKWNKEIFKNDNPIVLELGCGKGEYSVGLAKQYPDKNFIGIDIKGARIWKGAKTALQSGLSNVFFLRIRIDFIDKFFAKDEISEIWIPHPDPQPKKPSKRLTSVNFLRKYQTFIKNNAIIHLKTDNHNLYNYTLDVVRANNLSLLETYDDIHAAGIDNEITQIRTFYEQMFLDEGSKITYIKFSLNNNQTLKEPPERLVPGYKY